MGKTRDLRGRFPESCTTYCTAFAYFMRDTHCSCTYMVLMINNNNNNIL